MGEVLRIQREVEPVTEDERHLLEVFKLLARLVERTGDLPSSTKKKIRTQIQDHLDALGVQDLEDYEKLSEVYAKIDEAKRKLPDPKGYPEKEEFLKRLSDLYFERNSPVPREVFDQPLACFVAAYGQADWRVVEGRGGKSIADYLYDLGKIMTSRLAYEAIFDPKDAILIGKGWKIENGRHRALALKILGSDYVSKSEMRDWVLVKKEK